MYTKNTARPELEEYLRTPIGQMYSDSGFIATPSPSQIATVTGFLQTLKDAPPIQQRSCAGFSPDFLHPMMQNLPTGYEIVSFKSYYSSDCIHLSSPVPQISKGMKAKQMTHLHLPTDSAMQITGQRASH